MSKCLPIVLCLLVCSVGALPGNDGVVAKRKSQVSLSERLADVTNVGLIVEEKLGGFQLIVYSEEQNKQNLALLEKYNKDSDDWPARFERYEADIQKELKAGRFEAAVSLRKIQMEPLRYPFDPALELFRVLTVADDYIELEAAGKHSDLERKSVVVVPFQKMALISFPQQKDFDLYSKYGVPFHRMLSITKPEVEDK